MLHRSGFFGWILLGYSQQKEYMYIQRYMAAFHLIPIWMKEVRPFLGLYVWTFELSFCLDMIQKCPNLRDLPW